jgi:hypothetical protein
VNSELAKSRQPAQLAEPIRESAKRLEIPTISELRLRTAPATTRSPAVRVDSSGSSSESARKA